MAMDFEVAVEKLNSMPVHEIIARANELPCVHIKGDNKECIIANILIDLTGIHRSQISVGSQGVLYRYGIEMREAEWASHISELITRFDKNPGKFVTKWRDYR